MLRRNGWDGINRIAGCNCFNPTDSLAGKTNKKEINLTGVHSLVNRVYALNVEGWSFK